MPSTSVGSLHVKYQHNHNLTVTIDVEVSNPCHKNNDHLVVEVPMDPTTHVCQNKFVKKDVKKELKLVNNFSEKEHRAINFNDIIQDGLLLPSTHKDDTHEEIENHETTNFAKNRSLEHLNGGQKRKFNSSRKHMSEHVSIVKTTHIYLRLYSFQRFLKIAYSRTMYVWLILDFDLLDTTYYKLDDHFWTMFVVT